MYATGRDLWLPQGWAHVRVNFHDVRPGEAVIVRENQDSLRKLYEGVQGKIRLRIPLRHSEPRSVHPEHVDGRQP
jgi:hypothetical protein